MNGVGAMCSPFEGSFQDFRIPYRALQASDFGAVSRAGCPELQEIRPQRPLRIRVAVLLLSAELP